MYLISLTAIIIKYIPINKSEIDKFRIKNACLSSDGYFNLQVMTKIFPKMVATAKSQTTTLTIIPLMRSEHDEKTSSGAMHRALGEKQQEVLSSAIINLISNSDNELSIDSITLILISRTCRMCKELNIFSPSIWI